ncbi:MAG: tRNA (guanosine(37)-N1)-methyltransferase TrmD [Bdellovibrionaceae bacterium]|nr:tRNA (guanosine(37)-N1)-methyltransferase TrmD [Pseudobdellovibrionaceae bacterium]
MASLFQVITLFPEAIAQFAGYGVLSQAVKKELLQIESINPRKFTTDVHHSVDDRPFGGGDGMCMTVDALAPAVDEARARAPGARLIYVSPQGRPLTNAVAKELAQAGDLIFLSGRYAGVDQRLLNRYAFEEISIGDYVLSGGELAAMVIIDAAARFIPGVLGHQDSSQADSFEGGVLEAPQFTRPREIQGQAVPEVLMSGNHAKISEWRGQVSRLVTLKKRPDLFHALKLSMKELKSLRDFLAAMPSEERAVLGLTELDLDKEISR